MDIISTLLIIFVSIGIFTLIYLIISSFTIKKFVEIINLEVDCQSSYVIATIKNLGREDLKAEDIKVFVENQEANIFLNPSILLSKSNWKSLHNFYPISNKLYL